MAAEVAQREMGYAGLRMGGNGRGILLDTSTEFASVD